MLEHDETVSTAYAQKDLIKALRALGIMLENVALSHQIDVLNRSGKRPQFTNTDRLVWVMVGVAQKKIKTPIVIG